jgi:MipA family protein
MAVSSAEDVPNKNLEMGAGLLSIYGNHYRGSDQGKFWFFPIPYFTYRSERIEAEPSFIRGIFFHNEWFSFKLSLMLGLNVESKHNTARQGMPSLDYTIEAGPMFIFKLWHSEKNDHYINFEWPIRESFATDLSYIKPVGIFTVPYINIINSPTPSNFHWSSELSISPMYASKKYHHYFYGVDEQYAKIGRAAYTAHGGYSGLQFALVLNKRLEKLVIIPFIRFDYLKSATFEDSPLVKINHYAVGGLGLFHFF